MDHKANNLERAPVVLKEKQKGPSPLHLKEQKEAVTRRVVEIAKDLDEKETGFETGEVAEGLGEGKKVAPTGGFPVKKAAAHIKVAAKALVVPTIEVMQKQVANAVREQIRVLETQARKIIQSRVTFEPFALNRVVAKIRELKEILTRLTEVTFETLKGWWLKYVNGS